jgi:hypothetical protein
MNQGHHEEDFEHEADGEMIPAGLPSPPPVAAMADPRTLTGPVLLPNGILLAPPGLNYACPGCLWQTGAIRSFSIAAYAHHLDECPHIIRMSTPNLHANRTPPRPEPHMVSIDSTCCWL